MGGQEVRVKVGVRLVKTDKENRKWSFRKVRSGGEGNVQKKKPQGRVLGMGGDTRQTKGECTEG